jgi:TatD DNase family protein
VSQQPDQQPNQSDAAAPQWIDSHCHVHGDGFPDGPGDAIEAAAHAGVTTLITVGCDRATSLAAITVAEDRDSVFATVGLHPHDAVNGVDTISDLIATPGVVAVGEAGLDYFYDHSPRELQQRAFAEQIQLANEHDLALVVHTRDAWADTFDVLAAEGVPTRTILHCFTGGPEEAQRGLDIGAYLSFSGIVTFKGAPDVQAAATMCPLDRILVETDSPYLAPVPHRGKQNQPAWVPHVGQFIADLRDVAVGEIAAATTANTRQAFALPDR